MQSFLSKGLTDFGMLIQGSLDSRHGLTCSVQVLALWEGLPWKIAFVMMAVYYMPLHFASKLGAILGVNWPSWFSLMENPCMNFINLFMIGSNKSICISYLSIH